MGPKWQEAEPPPEPNRSVSKEQTQEPLAVLLTMSSALRTPV